MQPAQLLVTTTSDRGLCGAIHSGICRKIRANIAEMPADTDYQIVTVGDKTRGILQRAYGDKFIMAATEVGRLPTQFGESAFIATEIIKTGYEFNNCHIYHNEFK